MRQVGVLLVSLVSFVRAREEEVLRRDGGVVEGSLSSMLSGGSGG